MTNECCVQFPTYCISVYYTATKLMCAFLFKNEWAITEGFLINKLRHCTCITSYDDSVSKSMRLVAEGLGFW